MGFLSSNDSVSNLAGLDSDLLVENYMARSAFGQVDNSVETSLFDDLSIAVQAGIYGMANNAMNIGNYFGGDFETYDVATELEELGDAYLESKDSYDLAGNIITSFVPGTIAFKALNAMKLGKTGGVVSRTLGYFDNQSKRALEETAGIYRNSLDLTQVKALKRKAFAYSTLDEVVSGAVIGASIEVSQNLGGILVDESLSFGEKVSKFTQPVLLGAAIGAPFGGLQYLSNFRSIAKPSKTARDGVLGDLSYSQLVTNKAGIADKSAASNHILDELDRIEAYKPIPLDDFGMVEVARADFATQAKNEYTRLVSEISTSDPLKGNFSKADKDVVDALNEIVETSITTKQGRATLRNLMDNVYKADTISDHPAQVILKKTNKVKNRDLGMLTETPSADPYGIQFQGSDFKMIPLTQRVRERSKKYKDKNKPLSAMAINTDHPAVINNLEKYTILNRIIGGTSESVQSSAKETSVIKQINNAESFLKFNGIDVDKDKGIFAVLAKTKEVLRSEDNYYLTPPKVKTKEFVDGMESLFKSIDDNGATEYLLSSESAKWVNVKTGAVAERPLTTLYGKNLPDIAKPKVLDANTSLEGIQKLRLQAEKGITDKKGTQYFYDNLQSAKKTNEGELKAWAELDALTDKALRNGDSKVKLGDDSLLDFGEVYQRLRSAKSKAYVELSKNNSAEDVMHTLGVSNISSLLSKAVAPANPSVEQMRQLVGETKGLTDLTYIRLGLKTSTLSPEETLLASAVESGRMEQVVQLKEAASHSVGEDLEKIFVPLGDLGYVEDISNAGRFVFDSHLKGDVGSLNYKSVHIGDQKIALADRLRKSIQENYNMDAMHNALLEAPESYAELAAFNQWYRGRGDKFETILEKDGSVTMLDVKSAAEYRKYESQQVDLAEEVVPAQKWIESNITSESSHYVIQDSLAASYVSKIQEIDYERIRGPKNMQEEALGNTVNDSNRFTYMPQRDLPYSRYFRVETNDPFSQTKSTLYKVHADSERALSKEISMAQAAFKSKGINAKMLSSTNAETQARHKLEFAYDGVEVSQGRVNNDLVRDGAHPDYRLDTVQEFIHNTNQWIKNGTDNIATGAVELHYADEISRINSLANVENSYRFGGDDSLRGKDKNLANPGTFRTIHNQMLGRDAPFSVYNKVNNFISEGMATLLQPVHEARLLLREALSDTGKITRADIMKADALAKKALEDRGVESPIGSAVESYLAKETTLTGKDINEAVAGLQYIASTLLLRLDGIDPIMNVFGMTVKMSSEMKYIQQIIGDDAVKGSRVEDVYSKWFGAGNFKTGEGIDVSLLSPYKAVATGMKDMFTGKELVTMADGTTRNVSPGLRFLEELEDLGIYKGDIKIMMELADDLVVPQGLSEAANKARFLGKTRDAVGKATQWLTTPHKASINLTQYTALKFASDVADAAGVDIATKRMLMSGMNHRVNAISSHVSKPRLFQGLVGNAVSLYQSYFSHTIGNVIRHATQVGSGPVLRNIAMNASFFGAQSTPAFDQINKQIAGQQDRNNADLYSTAYELLPEPLADALMFGVGSAVLRADLASRGDLTPRYKMVIPTTVGDLPVVGAIVNTVGAVIENTKLTASGQQGFSQGISNTIIDSKLNRPMAGLMRVLEGKTTDGRNNLVSTHDDLISWGNAVRLAGAKPMDEARVNQAFWNLQSYRIRDQERKTNLGNVMKQEFRSNPAVMDNPDWINSKYQSYINAGGNHRNFARFYREKVLGANTDFEQRLQVSIKDLDTAKNYKNVLGID